MSLIEEISKTDKNKLFVSNDNVISYETGFTVLDYANGYWTLVRDKDGNEKVIPMLGIQAGSLISIISEVGGGKSTLASQIGWNIVKKFEDGLLIYVDCEETAIKQRITNICKCKYDDPRIIINRDRCSIEDVLTMFNDICDKKEAAGKTYMYEIKDRSYDGKPFWQYVPTVFIIDSLPQFNSKEYNTEDLGNNVDQMKASKDVTRFYTNVLLKCWKYNVIFIVINHIRPNTNITPYSTPPRGLLMLNPMTESLPRGTVAQYYSTTYFRIKTKKSNAYTMAEDGFVGYKCEVSLAKTKSNVVGTSFPLTFNLKTGFDNIYSLFEFAKENDLIKGKNPYLRFENYEERKFSRKEFYTLMCADPVFRERVLKILKPYFEELLGDKKIILSNDVQEEINIDFSTIE